MAIETPPAPTTRPAGASSACAVATAATQQPIGLYYVCPACFGPLEVDYDYAVVGRHLTRETIAARAPGHLAVRRAPARSMRRRRADCRSGRRRCSPADRLAPDARARPAVDQGRHPQPVAVVQGPGGRGRRGPGARIRGRGAGLRVHRQPRRRDRGGGGGRRPAGLRVHPGRPRAGQGRPRAGLRRDGRARSRAPTTTSTGSASRSPTRPAGASSTSTSARSTPRGPRRSPTRSPNRSAGGRRTSSSRRSRRARCSPGSPAGSRSSPTWG